MAKRKARRTVKAKAKKKAPKMAARRRTRQAPRARKAKAPRRGSGQAPRGRSAKAPRRTPVKASRRAAQAPRQAKKAKPAARKRAAVKSARPRPPALQRERRRLTETITASVPSSLDFDRTASSAKSGRNAMLHHRREHTETGPALTGGDLDADWEEGYSEGDEAPGGDNPTPDQDVVEEIGRALGVEYEDAEELKGANKISERDTNRWEYDPASAEDYRDRNKKQ